MQNAKDLQKNIFSECKDIIINISQISNADELLEKHYLFSQILEQISVLKFIETHLQDFDYNEQISNDFQEDKQDFQAELALENEKTEEEITLENIETKIEENIIEEENTSEIIFDLSEEEEIPQKQIQETTEIEIMEEEEISTNITFDLVEEEEELLPEIEIPEVEEISEIETVETVYTDTEENNVIENQKEASQYHLEEPKEKKLKLAKIKIQNPHINTLFDEETMNEITEKPLPKEPAKTEQGRREFALDLNDRIAFSKMLFDGSQVELSNVVKRLNAFNNLDDAKQYLSDMYYDKGWDKVDEYAQRLWILVENKFL